MTNYFQPIGPGEWVSSPASERFDVWTRGNAGEVFPEVMMPLSFSLSWKSGEAAFRRAMSRGGATLARDFAEGPDVAVASGVFGGYSYLNLSYSRVLALRLPGATIDDVDRMFLGAANPPPHVHHRDDKSLLASARSLKAVWTVLGTSELPGLEADKKIIAQLHAQIGDVRSATDVHLRSLVDRFTYVFDELFETHLVVSSNAGLAVGALSKICKDSLDDESIAVRLLGGLGEVESAAPSYAIWDLGRLVNESPLLSAIFDEGVEHLQENLRLRANTSGVGEFNSTFAEFIAEFGSRGPNEWDTAYDTWETDPMLAYALIDRMRGAAKDHDPRLQKARLALERNTEEAAALNSLGWLNQRIFKRVLRAARLLSQGRERSKTTIVKAIHEVRLSAKELDRRVVERSGGKKGDMWFVTIDELDDYLANPASFAAVIEERTKMHKLLSSREPPFFFVGEQPSFDTWQFRDRQADPVVVGEVLGGLPGCSGRARGRARIVTDPSDPGALGPGDVLIARLTDPSWTPLFVPAEAVVVDVGAIMSHAIIVSRELGIPCVVSVTDATRRIPDGALIEVDGDSGTVTILELPDGVASEHE